ncbi:MAG: hypothetical protein WDO16_04390 [Bacteroidota bacterium]
MKKIIITLAVALSTLSSFAREAEVSSRVLDAFKNEFAGAKEVAWTSGDNFYKAEFLYNDQHVFAFYSTVGELLGMTRYISSPDLPLALQSGLKKGYGNYWISDLFEVSNADGTGYYITMENADSKVVLKSTGGGNWDVYKKTAKA